MHRFDVKELGRYLDGLVDEGTKAMRITAEAAQIMYQAAARDQIILEAAARIGAIQAGAPAQPLHVEPAAAPTELPPSDYQAQHHQNGTYYSRHPDDNLLKKAMNAAQRSDEEAVYDGFAAAGYGDQQPAGYPAQPQPPIPPTYGQERGGYGPPPRAPNPNFHGRR
jgi:hypothetical protein